MQRPFVTVNMAMTADGKITSARREYPRFTSEMDRRQMDRLRAEADALLLGAGTVRADNPSWQVRTPEMQEYRRSLGKADGLLRVLVSSSGRLDPDSRFFEGRAERIIASCEVTPDERLLPSLDQQHLELALVQTKDDAVHRQRAPRVLVSMRHRAEA